MSTSPPVKVFVEAPVTFGPGLVEGPARTLGRQDDAKDNDDKGRDRWAIASQDAIGDFGFRAVQSRRSEFLGQRHDHLRSGRGA